MSDRSMQDIRDAIPAEYFHRNTPLSMLYLIQDLVMAGALLYAGTHIDPWFNRLPAEFGDKFETNELYIEIGRWTVWGL